MTAASFVPYSAVAMIGVLDNWHGIVQYLAFALAGLLQGALIGFGQALSIRNTVVAVPGKQWVLVSALAGGALWMIALIPGFFVTPDFGNIFVAIITAIFLLAVLAVFPYVQTRVLRYRIRSAWRWIPITVGSWLVGALVFGLFTLLVRGEDTSLILTIFVLTVGGTAGLLVATVLQGIGLRRLSFDTIAHPNWGNILPDTPRVIAARKKVGAASQKAQAQAQVAGAAAKKRAAVVAKSASQRASSAASKAASRVKKKR